MVTRPYYDDEEPSFRRYSARGHGYPLSHDRELPPAPLHISYDNRRSHHPTAHEIRNGDNSNSPDQDSNARPRSRIPVACGRCRKRKIRCSGDNGGPCSNCKSAGNEQCQFLRVSSTEAQMKNDGSSSDFNYDPGAAASRLQCRMIPQGPQYAPPATPSVSYEAYQYRNNSLSSYQYPVKPYYTIPTFTEFAEDNVDYGLQASPYQLITPDHLGLSSSSNYGASGPGRGWTPAPQLPKSASLFLEQEPVYNHGQLSYHPGSFPLRPAISPETKALALSGIPSLPAPVAGNDRVLPYPATNRPAQVGSFLRNVDGLITNSQSGYQSYNNMMTPNMLSSVKAINNNTVSDSSSYLPMSSTSPESLASSQLAYSTSDHSVSVSQHQNEIYTSNEGLYHTSEPSDSSYGPSSGGSKRGSHSSQTTNAEGSMPSPSDGNLANGHTYVPFNSPSAYPAPRMDIPPPRPLHVRRRPSLQTVVGLASN